MVLLSSLKCSSNHPLDWLSSQAHSLALAWDYTLRGSWQMHIYVIVSCFQSFRKTGILLLTWDLCHHGGLPQAQSPPGGATRAAHSWAPQTARLGQLLGPGHRTSALLAPCKTTNMVFWPTALPSLHDHMYARALLITLHRLNTRR